MICRARISELEPGMLFWPYRGGPALEWVGVEPVVSRFPGKDRVRVLVADGPSYVADRREWVTLVPWDREGR